MQGSGFRVQGAGFRVQGSGFKVVGSGPRVASHLDGGLVEFLVLGGRAVQVLRTSELVNSADSANQSTLQIRNPSCQPCFLPREKGLEDPDRELPRGPGCCACGRVLGPYAVLRAFRAPLDTLVRQSVSGCRVSCSMDCSLAVCQPRLTIIIVDFFFITLT